MRTNFAAFRNSRIPEVLGRCVNDTPYLLGIVNEAIQRLLLEDQDGSFWGTNQKMVFNVVSNQITGPREVARVSDLSVCGSAINIQNQFYEFLFGGGGLQPPNTCTVNNGPIQALDRGTVSTLADFPSVNSYVRAYLTDARDVGKKVYIVGKDQNGLVIREQDGYAWNDGFNLVLAQPFVTSGFTVSQISGVHKDSTYGDVVLYAVNPDSGVETLLSRYAADEEFPAYRRYYLTNLPSQCCSSVTPVQVIGLVKLEFIPVTRDSDFLLIGNLAALKEECLAIKYSEMETEGSVQLSQMHHKKALALLNKELRVYEGDKRPAVNVAIYGTAHLRRHSIGVLT